jgi:hypothetical protein
MTWAVFSYRATAGASKLAMVAKRSYRFAPGKRCERQGEATIAVKPRFAAPRAGGAGFRMMTDDSDHLAAEKLVTDVLLRGSAHALNGPIPRLDVTLRVGSIHKSIRVHGDRSLETVGGMPLFSTPKPFTTMELDWSRAYGGVIEQPAQKWVTRRGIHPVLAYPRNPFGRGFVVDVQDGRTRMLPNLEDANDPLTPDRFIVEDPDRWIDQPVAAGFAPIDPLMFPRSAFVLCPLFGEPRRRIREVVTGVLQAEELERARRASRPESPRRYNSAPAGQAVCRLGGGERVLLSNLHPVYPVVEFDLPSERPRMLIEPPGCRIYELEPLLQTVLIEPDEDRVTLTWAASMPVAAPFPEEMCRSMRSNVLFN